MHIGLIGGIGPAATEFYYRGLVRASAAEPLELTIAHADMVTLLRNLGTGSSQAQASVFCHHVEQLANAGAEIAAVTSIAGHFCISELQAISPLPLLNAITVLREELCRRGIGRVGVIGSSVVMQSGLYGALADIEVVVPPEDELKAVGEEYIAMAKSQRVTSAQRELLHAACARLCVEQRAEVVLLAGTDLFLAFEGESLAFSTLDCAQVHIDALARATGHVSVE